MGKTSQSSTRGKQDSKERVSSAKNIDVTSRKIAIWPEWTDAELSAEKWDLGGGKGKDKGRVSQAVVPYEDPEGVVLPPSLAKGGRVCWKRITDSDVLPAEPPVIVSDPECTEIDLVSANSHLMQSELMCWVISQLQALWHQRHHISIPPTEGSGSDPVPVWRPWEHIHPHPKGAPAPQFNTGGKYCVRLYWMGLWRKVTIDDQLPFWEPEEATESQQAPGGRGFTLLLPATPSPRELWPALLTKAILKIAALDYGGGSRLSEFGECSVIHLLTGWTLQVLPIRSADSTQLWELLADLLPLWERPAEKEEGEEGEGEGTRMLSSGSKDSEAPRPKQGRSAILLASFTGSHQESGGETLPQPPLLREKSTSEGLLKRAHLLSPRHSLARVPSHPMLLTLVRDKPLEPPPKEPPPPTLQAPYYLGLRHRQTWPGDPTPPPTPSNAEQKFVEIFPPFPPTSADGTGEGGSGKRVWMDYPDFSNAFTSLHVFRNPACFPHKEVYCNLSRTVESSVLSGATTKKASSSSQLASASKAALTNKNNNILFVDSPAPVTFHLVFSSLSNWREGQRNLKAIARPSIGLLERASATAESTKEDHDSSDSTEADEVPATTTPATTPPAREHIAVGTLTVAPYRWDSLQAGPPVLRVGTTGTRGAMLSVPAGRHVFTLHIQAPIGHHLEVLSLSPFQLTSGDAIFSHLSKESSRFLLHCSQFAEALLSVTEGGGESQAVAECVLPSMQGLKSRHMKLMLASSLHAVASLGTGWGLNESMTSSWRAFLSQVFSSLEPHLPSDGRPAMDASTASKLLGSHGSPKTTPTRTGSSTPAAAARRASTATTGAPSTTETASGKREHQSGTHGSPGSKPMQRASTISTMDVWESLAQSVALVQPHSEALGTAIFSGLFRLDPSALGLFPFHVDEQARAYSRVLSGSLPSLQPHSWTVVFREVFHVPEPQLIVPRLQCPVSSSLLRVINNDTGEETRRVFQSVAPHTYQPNKAGYTFVAEAWSESEGVEGGRWELRLVCSSARMPVRREGEDEGEVEVSSTFHAHEIQEYCLPNRENQLFRFAMKVTQDCPVSIQLSTSKRDAYFKLEVFDHEMPVAGTQGRGHGVIPVYSLLRGSRATKGNTIAEEEEEAEEEDTSVSNVEDEKPHKYILQATIVRDSWPIADTAWPYISMIKSLEKQDEGRSGSEQQSLAKKTKSKEKGGGKKGAAQSAPAKMDTSKPHWTLRVVTKNEDRECLEVHKDTERADELKGMVQAWEAEQPGRCKKAQESRQKFLESRALKDTSEEDQSTAVSVLSESSSVPQPPSGPVQLRQIDLSPFIVSDSGSPRLLDETEQAVQQQERQQLFREYRARRQAVLQRREEDRETRNQAKVAQLELAEQWQANLDELRNKLNAGRQAIRERHLAKERAKMEAEAASQRAAEEQAAAGRESKKGKAKGKKK